MWTTYNIKKWEVDLSLSVKFSSVQYHNIPYYKLNKSATSLGGEKGNFGCWHAVKCGSW